MPVVGLLTLLNAPFDWASLGLTRALLRRGLELGGWWPYLLALVDAPEAPKGEGKTKITTALNPSDPAERQVVNGKSYRPRAHKSVDGLTGKV